MEKINFGKSAVLRNIYSYQDYRELLTDYFSEQKKMKYQFSHRFFAQKAGISSSGYCAKVLNGKLRVSQTYAEKLSKGMGLNDDEKRFFCLLVESAHAEEVERKLKLQSEIDLLREKSELKDLSVKEVDLFKHWYIPVVMEILHYGEWKGDYKRLGKMVYPPISAKEAEDAVVILKKIGMIVAVDGGYEKVNSVMSSAKIPAYARRKARAEIMDRAKESVELLKPSERHMSYTTLSMGEKTYKKVEEYINKVRHDIIDMVLEDDDVDKIYHAVFELFPSSTSITRPTNSGGKE